MASVSASAGSGGAEVSGFRASCSWEALSRIVQDAAIAAFSTLVVMLIVPGLITVLLGVPVIVIGEAVGISCSLANLTNAALTFLKVSAIVVLMAGVAGGIGGSIREIKRALSGAPDEPPAYSQ